MNQAKDAAAHASSSGYFSELLAAAGAALAGFATGRRRRSPQEFDDDHPLIMVIREEGIKTRSELERNREVMHQVVTGIEVLKDRRP